MPRAQLMEDAGFSNVYRLVGNYGVWTGVGYDVAREEIFEILNPSTDLTSLNSLHSVAIITAFQLKTKSSI